MTEQTASSKQPKAVLSSKKSGKGGNMVKKIKLGSKTPRDATEEERSTETNKEKKTHKSALNKKRKNQVNEDSINEDQSAHNELNSDDKNKKERPMKTDKEKKTHKSALSRKTKNQVNEDFINVDQSAHKELNNEDANKKERPTKTEKEKKTHTIALNRKRKNQVNEDSINEDQSAYKELNNEDANKKKSKKHGKKKIKDQKTARKTKSEEKHSEVSMTEVEEIMSVEEDCSRGMKKWLIEYRESRPGLKILQQRNDDFIASYEAQQEEERIEREERIAEGGWTVVTHHKGRKKSTDTESGISVGSVAQAALMDKVAKKKTKEIGLDFYRFQRREAQRNDVMRLQTKFEEDKKRIQELRAARKFRPY